MSQLRQAARVIDRKPWAAHLYVTDRCNLDCHYCNEFDNSRPHPELSDLKRRLDKIRALGVLRIGLQGGEPLIHPDIVEVVAHAKRIGLAPVSLASNGFPLDEEMLRGLERAGLDSMNISVDRMTPTASTRKALKTVLHRLDWFADSPIRLAVSGVLFRDSLEEMEQVIDTCLDRGVAVHARVVHDDLIHDRALRDDTSASACLQSLERQEALKRAGARIHTSWNLIEYQKAMLRGRPPAWTCVAGYKYFFVSARGKFWLCSQVRTEHDLMDITPADLRSYDTAKSCQTRCGVYCTIDTSMKVKRPFTYARTEALGRLRAGLGRWAP